MLKDIELYKDRYISFEGTKKVEDWNIKTYTISQHPTFQSLDALETIHLRLRDWLQYPK